MPASPIVLTGFKTGLLDFKEAIVLSPIHCAPFNPAEPIADTVPIAALPA